MSKKYQACLNIFHSKRRVFLHIFEINLENSALAVKKNEISFIFLARLCLYLRAQTESIRPARLQVRSAQHIQNNTILYNDRKHKCQEQEG